MYHDGFHCRLADQLMGETAENLVDQYKITREEQDAYAARSQQRAEAARKRGRFEAEKVGIPFEDKKKGEWTFTEDEHARDGVTAASLAKLEPVFRKTGSVHAGNSSGITDGASAVRRALGERGRAAGREADGAAGRLRRGGRGPEADGHRPGARGEAPARAARGLPKESVDLWELNEAFAAQVIACNRELEIDEERLNADGGAIALGHPIGATGCRILTTLIHSLAERNQKRGVATLCISGGLGLAAMIERV